MTISQPNVAVADMLQLLADSMTPERNIVDAMDQLVEACAACTTAVAANAFFSDWSGRLFAVAHSGQGALDVSEAQLTAGTGPAYRAIHASKPLELPEIGLTRGFWQSFAEQAEFHDFHAGKFIPMRFRDNTFGGLTLYFNRPGPSVIATLPSHTPCRTSRFSP